MAAQSATIHASAVLVGAHAVLIRGPSGAGKSRLVQELLQVAQAGLMPFVRLVADDRAYLEARNGRLLVRPAPELAGLIEFHGVGIRRMPYEPAAVVGLVVDLAAEDAARLAPATARETVIDQVAVPRLAVAAGASALPSVLALLTSADAGR
jgi:serine kinase of HPr protein (carbohydrate metabolism regulator)